MSETGQTGAEGTAVWAAGPWQPQLESRLFSKGMKQRTDGVWGPFQSPHSSLPWEEQRGAKSGRVQERGGFAPPGLVGVAALREEFRVPQSSSGR